MKTARWLLLGAPLVLLLGVLGGLARVGVGVAPGAAVGWHGPLLIGGFFAAVISVERAAASGGGWRWSSPALSLAGSALMLAGLPGWGLPGLLLGALVLAAATVESAVRHPERHHTWMAVGTLCLLAADALWMSGMAIHRSLPLGMGFLLLTILGERLELSRLLQKPRWATWLFDGLAGVLVAGLVLHVVEPGMASVLIGASLVLLALWLGRFDIVRVTLRRTGQTRYVAVCLAAGYVWLVAAGLAWLLGGALSPDGGRYDAIVHAILLGFVFSMVFGHAPIILPAVARVRVRFSGLMYVPLAVLHVAVGTRFAAGLWGEVVGRQVGAALSAVALVLFAIGMARGVILARSSRRVRAGPDGAGS